MKYSTRGNVDPFIVMDVMENARKAEEAGLHVSTVTDAVDGADFVMILAPDEFQQGVYESEIKIGRAHV